MRAFISIDLFGQKKLGESLSGNMNYILGYIKSIKENLMDIFSLNDVDMRLSQESDFINIDFRVKDASNEGDSNE